MQQPRLVLVAATTAILLACVAPITPVAADALYPAGDAGTWSFDRTCQDASWAQSYSLWYIIDDAQDYPFDIPDPDLIPGENVTVTLTPVVVGSLAGTVTLTGSSTITGQVPAANPYPGDTVWQDRLSAETFTVTYEPGGVSTGTLPVPDEWADQFVGFAALEATISGDLGSQAIIVMLAQPFVACEGVEPSPSASVEPTRSPRIEPRLTLPPTDRLSRTLPLTDGTPDFDWAIGLFAWVFCLGLVFLTRRGTIDR